MSSGTGQAGAQLRVVSLGLLECPPTPQALSRRVSPRVRWLAECRLEGEGAHAERPCLRAGPRAAPPEHPPRRHLRACQRITRVMS